MSEGASVLQDENNLSCHVLLLFFLSLSKPSVRLKTVGGRGDCSTNFISSRRVSLAVLRMAFCPP